jgi:hypothetical protein
MTDDRPWTVAVFAALLVLLSASEAAAEAVKINEIVIAASIPDAQRDATVAAARAFFAEGAPQRDHRCAALLAHALL